MTFPSGETIPMAVSSEEFDASVHGGLLECGDCHGDYEQVPHPAVAAESYRDYSIGRYEVCRRCHFSNYAKTLDSVHYQVLSDGNLDAPICTDCHGAHDTGTPDDPPSRSAATCAECHSEVYEAYRESVHGQALVDGENLDVPACTYCHGVHNIGSPEDIGYRLDIPELCGGCHADKVLMAPYGLSTDVLDTYLRDFHGATISLVRNRGSDDRSFEAVCTDCHGIHDIVAVRDPASPVLKANLVETCRQCHEGATESFPTAWLSHYEASLAHAPLVFTVRTFYKVIIPLMVVGLLGHIVLGLWRSTANR